MNCIFCCVFTQWKYVDMFFLLLESIFIYGNLDCNTHVLVYTSTSFMNKIKQSHLFNNEKIKFEINDNYNDIDKACKARLDVFKFASIINYNKILYLDTDILVKDSINKVFDVCKDDILYVLEEGNIANFHFNNIQPLSVVGDHWGRTLFGDELVNYNDTSGFTTGMLLFNNCEKIKNLFDKINEDIIKRPYSFDCFDQPYIVYNAFKYNLYNNKILKNFAVNSDKNIYSDKVIHHFPGGPGNYGHKIENMKIFLDSIKDFTICNAINDAKNYINMNLLPIINNCGELLEGNIFMSHHTTTYTDTFLNKTKNISNIVLNKNLKDVMEIGFNAGFSTLLMLLSNPNINITCFDLGEHTYTMPCYEKMKETFGDRINIIIGDSTKTLQNVNTIYDLIHIDGGHSTEVANSDIINSYRLSRRGTILIMDDYDFPNLHNLWDNYVIKYNLKNLHINVYNTVYHDIKYVDVDVDVDAINAPISKVLFQTHKKTPDKYVLDMIKNILPCDWKYEFYNDENIIQFFIDNPITELPDIINKFYSFNNGAHRADLFRYYYIYVRGGVFMDSDAMLYTNIDMVVKNYDFISVNSSINPGAIFQGIIGASPGNKIIKEALFHAYNISTQILDKEYHHLCRELYNIITRDDFGYTIKLYEEKIINDSVAGIYNGEILLFKHYWHDKIIPYLYTDWNDYNNKELDMFDFRVLTTYTIPNNMVRLGSKHDGGYIIADGFDYDLFISCGIGQDVTFEESFLDIHKIKCVAFDGTIETFPYNRNDIEWIPKNVGYFNTEKTTNLKEYMQGSKKIFLKMDIEGSEFNWIESMKETELDNISQIAIEIHWPFDIYRMNMLKKLNNTHYIIHIHGNNYCDRDIPKGMKSGRTYDGTVTINNPGLPTIKLPEVLELTYINKKLIDNLLVQIKEIQFPTYLDFPNNPSAPDIQFSIAVLPILENKTYSWGNSYIKFLDNFKMSAFGQGEYKIIDKDNIIAIFGGRIHKINFNNNYTEFSSIREDDLLIVTGKLINENNISEFN